MREISPGVRGRNTFAHTRVKIARRAYEPMKPNTLPIH